MERIGRKSAYDKLRVLAAFSVVLLHASAQYWYYEPVTNVSWMISNAYDAMSRIGVPIFVMLSGALFLGQEKAPEWKQIVKHNVLRLLVIYAVWCVAYGILTCFRWGAPSYTVKQVAKAIFTGSYHLWYLPMIMGLYLLSPILHDLVHKLEKQKLEYFLWLFVIFQLGRFTCIALFGQSDFWVNQLDKLEIPMVSSYVAYYVLGFYLVEYGMPKKWIRIFQVGIVPAFLCNVGISTFMSLRQNMPNGSIYDSYGLATAWIVVAVFATFVCGDSEEVSGKALEEISKDTFGVYLMHVGLIEILMYLGIHTKMVPNWIGIPLVTIIVFVISTALAAILRRIPFVGKYIC